MTASVITALVPVREDATWTETPYALTLKGKPEPRVKVVKLLDPDTGAKSVRVSAPAGLLGLSTMDAIARRLVDGAKVQSSTSASAAARVRVYA